MDEINVFWFRRDLRSHDNRGLYQALTSGLPVLPIFIFDKDILDELEDSTDARVTFIHRQIMRLHQTFRKIGSGLLVYHRKPFDAFKDLLEKYDVKGVFTNEDYEPYARERDDMIRDLLTPRGVKFVQVKDQVIFSPEEILNEQGHPYKVFTPYKNKWRERLKPADYDQVASEQALDNLFQMPGPDPCSLASLGFKETSIEIPSTTFNEEIISRYHQNRDFPGLQGTTRLSLHLRHGTVSIREAVSKGVDLSDTWLNELVWREFYMMVLYHWPQVVDQAFKPQYDRIEWLNDESVFRAWCEGKTGFPIVDAGMRELNNTGFMHNRVRMITSSFLSKMLLIDWRWGERYFAEKLLDYELSSNNGGWQWAAGTGTDAQPYFRIFNPYTQTEKFDKDQTYIKKWIPELNSDAYPDPIIDYKMARQRALETYKVALS
ncbi:MAG: deoxyribodipyrimidine photo-lyase [Cyclobacteriaceae bacterium]